MIASFIAQRSHAVHERTAHKGKIGARSQYAGYIGARLAELAIESGREVVLADNWFATDRAQAERVEGARVETADIRDRASFTVEAVTEREQVTDHDVAAFVDVVAQSIGDAGRWVHHGTNDGLGRAQLDGQPGLEGRPVNVLVVQDDPRIASFITRGLEAEGFAVRSASDGALGLRMTESSEFDLIILDLVLPTVTGEEVLTQIRGRGSTVPVIVLTSKDAVSDRVANLDAGADDYVTKPFSLTELLARVRARLRSADQAASTTISHGRVTVDVRARQALIDG